MERMCVRNSSGFQGSFEPSGRELEVKRRGATNSITVSEGTVVLDNHSALRYDYTIDVGVTDDTGTPRAVVTRVEIRGRDGDNVTSDVDKELGRAKRMAMSWASSWWPGHKAATPAADLNAAAAPVIRQVDDSELRAVAKTYKAAQRKGRPTGPAVQAAIGGAPELARKRVLQARRAGYLPPAGGTTRPRLG